MTPSTVPKFGGLRLRRGLVSSVGVGALLCASFAGPALAADDEFDSGLVINGSFEDGDTGWRASGGQFSISDDAYEGSKSGYLSERVQFFDGLQGTLTEPLAHDGEYRLTAKVKFDGDQPSPIAVAYCQEGSSCVQAKDATKTLTAGQWADYELNFVPEDSPHYITENSDHSSDVFTRFQLETPWSSTTSFKIDNVKIERIDDPDVPPVVVPSLESVQTKPIGDGNPLVGHKFGADPHQLIFNGRLYIYSTNDTQQYEVNSKDENGLPTQGNGYGAIKTLNVMSTDDMVNWVDHGAVAVAGEGANAPFANNSWAPAAVARDSDGDGVDDTVYLYFCNGGSGTGVIVGDSPLGPWDTDKGRMIIGGGNPPGYSFPQGMWLFDPEVFVDVDGQPYLYFGGNSEIGEGPEGDEGRQGPQHPKSTRVAKLDKDDWTMLEEPDGSGIITIDAPGVFEASSMVEHKGKYYYSYSSNFGVKQANDEIRAMYPNYTGEYPSTGAIAYMVSDTPTGFTDPNNYAGVAFQNQGNFFGWDNGGNNHSSMFTYKDKTYLTYHAQTVGSAWAKWARDTLGIANAGTSGYRSVHIDEMEFDEDNDRILPVIGTYEGVPQVQDFNPYRQFEAETIAWQQGIRTAPLNTESVEFPEHGAEGNMVLTNIDNGDWVGLRGVNFGETSASRVIARVKALVEGTQIEVRLDAVDGELVSTIDVDSTIGEWAEVSASVEGATGLRNVFFVFKGSDQGRLVEVDTWQFTGVDEPSLVEVTPVAPTIEGNVVTIPSVEGVVYQNGAGSVVSGSVTLAAGQQLVVKAVPASGYVFPEGTVFLWEFTGVDGPGLIEVTPVAPSLTGGVVSIPVVEGVVYQDASGKVLTGSVTLAAGQKLTVRAVPADGYKFTVGAATSWEFSGAGDPGLIEVTPVPPTVKGNVVSIPVVEGVVYQDASGKVLTGSVTLAAGQKLTVRAVPADGYKFTVGAATSWEFSGAGDPGLIEVTPVPPTVKGNVVSIPVVEGVVYQDASGKVLTGSVTLAAGQKLTVRAVPADGYKFTVGAATSWEFTGVDGPGLIEVTPVPPTVKGNVVSIPVVEGVVYQDASGKVLTGSVTLAAGQKLTVRAVPADGYKFTDGAATSWEFEAAGLAEPSKPDVLSKTGAGVGTALIVALTLATMGLGAISTRRRRQH